MLALDGTANSDLVHLPRLLRGSSSQAPVVLRGLEDDGRPLILELPAAGDFVQAMLDKLKAGLEDVRRSRAADTTSVQLSKTTITALKLYHPAARVVHIALFELRCDDGLFLPPLDRARYVEGCLVVRRTTKSGLRRWGRDALGVQSWAPIGGENLDQVYPDPSKHVPAIRTGDPELDRELNKSAPVFDEARVPMFLAPPEVCAALGRTIAFAVVPTSSSDISAKPPPFSDPAALRAYIPAYLRSTGGSQRVPFPSQSVTYTTIASAAGNPGSGDNGLFLAFTLMLRQLVFEFGLFDATPSPSARQILAVLDRVSLRFKSGSSETTQSATAFLRNAANVLILRTSGAAVLMPMEWPALDAVAGSAIQNAVTQIVNSRMENVRPQEGRFDNPRNRYVLRGYARITADPDCPPATISSENSQVFGIAPWYEGKGAPVPIVLPEMNMDALRQLKPNVAFAVPNQLQSLLDLNDAKDLADGKGKNSTVQMTVDWLCSFSLPVITLCAFIVLNIFLQLLNIIFGWLFWLKICIPIPRPTVTDE